MLRFVVVALVIVEFVLLSALAVAPAQATISDPEVYTWGFVHPGSDRVVCKKLVWHPEKQVQSRFSKTKSVKMHSNSTIVDDSYCATLAKP